MTRTGFGVVAVCLFGCGQPTNTQVDTAAFNKISVSSKVFATPIQIPDSTGRMRDGVAVTNHQFEQGSILSCLSGTKVIMGVHPDRARPAFEGRLERAREALLNEPGIGEDRNLVAYVFKDDDVVGWEGPALTAHCFVEKQAESAESSKVGVHRQAAFWHEEYLMGPSLSTIYPGQCGQTAEHWCYTQAYALGKVYGPANGTINMRFKVNLAGYIEYASPDPLVVTRTNTAPPVWYNWGNWWAPVPYGYFSVQGCSNSSYGSAAIQNWLGCWN